MLRPAQVPWLPPSNNSVLLDQMPALVLDFMLFGVNATSQRQLNGWRSGELGHISQQSARPKQRRAAASLIHHILM
jgi:hypothetical protein